MCTVYVRIVKIPEFLAVSIDVMAGRTPGHRTITETGVSALSRYPVDKVENKPPYSVNSIEYHLPLDSV